MLIFRKFSQPNSSNFDRYGKSMRLRKEKSIVRQCLIGIVEKNSSYRFLFAGVLKHRLKEASGGVGWEEEPTSTLGLGGLVPALLSLGIILDLKDLITKFNKRKAMKQYLDLP